MSVPRLAMTVAIASLLSLFFVSSACGAPAPALTGKWCLSEASGLTAEDPIGGNTGRLTDMEESAWVAGPRGEGDAALEFDGIDDVLVMDNPDAFSFHRDFTWSAWIRRRYQRRQPGEHGR